MRHDEDIMVSVIMLTYNNERYLCKAIDSVLMQETSFRYEILIGDDASTDTSPVLLMRYQAKFPNKIRVFLSEKNQGTTKNAYNLFTQARGNYLASCESDDYWTDTHKLQKQIDFLEGHPEYIGCTHKVQCVDENDRPLPRQHVFWISNKRIFCLKDFKGIKLPGHSGSVVRRNIFRNPKFDYAIFYRAHPYIGDRSGMILFLAQGNFYQLSETMACYRRSTTSLTKRLYEKNPDHIVEELEFEECLEAYAKTVLHVDIGAEYYRRELLASAVWERIVQHDVHSKEMLKHVCNRLKQPVLAWLLLPFNMGKKFIRKYIFRNNI